LRIKIGFLLVFFIFCGCSGREWAYKNSPYDIYVGKVYDSDYKAGQEIQELIQASRKNPPETFWVHWQIAKWAYINKQYGTALFSLNELNKYYPNKDYVVYNIGVIMDKCGQSQAARGRFEYILETSDNYILRNRSLAILLIYDDGKSVEEDYYALSFN